MSLLTANPRGCSSVHMITRTNSPRCPRLHCSVACLPQHVAPTPEQRLAQGKHQHSTLAVDKPASALQDGPLSDTSTVSRRSTLLLLSAMAVQVRSGEALAVGAPPETPAADAPQPSPTLVDVTLAPSPAPSVSAPPTTHTYTFASDVPCNLRVKQYWSTITGNRTAVWQKIAQLIQQSEFEALSKGLDMAAAADMRQAALYIPWSLLQMNEYQAAVETRKTYKDWDDHVGDLQKIALAASNKAADPQQVQQAFILMSQSLDSYLTSVPIKYVNAPS